MSKNIRHHLLQISRALRNMIAPHAVWSEYAYEDTLRRYVERTRWLDLGCGHQIAPQRPKVDSEFVSKASFVVGLDPDLDSLLRHKSIARRVMGVGENLPFRGASFDLVTANMVFEHMERPEMVLCEIANVLAPKGVLIIHTPNRIGYDTLMARAIPYGIKRKIAAWLFGQQEDDVFPTFYRANRCDGIRAMAEKAGFETVEIDTICSSPVTALIPPIALIELLWLRLLRLRIFSDVRPVILAVLRKSAQPAAKARAHGEA